MTITYLIGNGFDLNLGLKTSFYDFNQSYRASIAEEDAPCIKKFKIKILENPDMWSSVERALGLYTSDFTIDEAIDFRTCLDDLHRKLVLYLSDQDSKFNVAGAPLKVKTAMYKGTVGLSQYLLTSFSNQHKVLQQGNENLNYQFINFNYTTVFDRCIKTLDPIDSRKIDTWTYEGKNRFHLLNLPIHVHGTTTDSMILGVNDESQVSNKSLLDVENIREIMIKPLANQSVHNTKTDTCINMIHSSNLIIVFGMSLGETDKLWWETILLWLRNDPKRNLVIFAWKDKYSKAIISDFLDLEKKTRMRLLSFSPVPDQDSDIVKNQVSVIANSEIFKI